MKITINSQRLAQELRALNKSVATKPVIPILSHILLRAGDDGMADDALVLQATDLEISTSFTCQATIHEPGVVALPAAKLLGLAERFPDQDVVITKVGAKATVESGRFTTTLHVLPVQDFPPFPEVEGRSLALDGAKLAHLIARTRYAVASSETQKVLRGALLTVTPTVVAMVTTDSKRLALATVARGDHADDVTEPFSIIITAKALDALVGMDSGPITFTVGERHLFFATGSGTSSAGLGAQVAGERMLIARVLNGKFPAYERVIPRANNLKLTVDRYELTTAIQRVLQVADEESSAIDFQAAPGVLRLSAKSTDVGSADEEVGAAYEGPEMMIKASGKHVLDFLSAAIEPSVTISMKDVKTPLLFSDGEGHLGVVVPIAK